MRRIHLASSLELYTGLVLVLASFEWLSCLTVEEAWATIRQGWTEYISQPVLPASLAYVLICFNVALVPGALMTTFLIHHGTCICIPAGPGCRSRDHSGQLTHGAPAL